LSISPTTCSSAARVASAVASSRAWAASGDRSFSEQRRTARAPDRPVAHAQVGIGEARDQEGGHLRFPQIAHGPHAFQAHIGFLGFQQVAQRRSDESQGGHASLAQHAEGGGRTQARFRRRQESVDLFRRGRVRDAQLLDGDAADVQLFVVQRLAQCLQGHVAAGHGQLAQGEAADLRRRMMHERFEVGAEVHVRDLQRQVHRVKHAALVVGAQRFAHDADGAVVRQIDGLGVEVQLAQPQAAGQRLDVLTARRPHQQQPQQGHHQQRQPPLDGRQRRHAIGEEKGQSQQADQRRLDDAVEQRLGPRPHGRIDRQVEQVHRGVVHRVLQHDVAGPRQRRRPQGTAGQQHGPRAEGHGRRQQRQSAEDAEALEQTSRQEELQSHRQQAGDQAKAAEEGDHPLAVIGVVPLQRQVEDVVGQAAGQRHQDDDSRDGAHQRLRQDDAQVVEQAGSPAAGLRACRRLQRVRRQVGAAGTGDEAHDDDADQQRGGDDEQQVGRIEARCKTGEDGAEEDVRHGAAAGDQSEEALGLARIEDVAGEGPELQDRQAADDLEEDEKCAQRDEITAPGAAQVHTKGDSAGGGDQAEAADDTVTSPRGRDVRIDRRRQHQCQRRQHVLVGNRFTRQRAEKQGPAGHLPGDDHAADEGHRVRQHQEGTAALPGMHPKEATDAR
jgi:hypothetical protein